MEMALVCSFPFVSVFLSMMGKKGRVKSTGQHGDTSSSSSSSLLFRPSLHSSLSALPLLPFPFFYCSSVLLCLSFNSINWTRLHYSNIRNWCEVSSHLSSNSQSPLSFSVLSHLFVISLDYSCVVCIIECCPCSREREREEEAVRLSQLMILLLPFPLLIYSSSDQISFPLWVTAPTSHLSFPSVVLYLPSEGHDTQSVPSLVLTPNTLLSLPSVLG